MKHPENWLPVQQQTPEWLIAKCGCVTASRISAVTKRLKTGGVTADYDKYKMEVLTEIIRGECTEHYVSVPMQWGIDNEPLARTEYELTRDVEVERVGFVLHPTIKRTGASPDGCVGEDGLVEFKCPTTTTHLGYIINGVVPEDYIPQMMWQMACTGYQWCDFVSYDPRLPEDFSLFVQRLHRDEKLIASMEFAVIEFLGEVEKMCDRLLKHRTLETDLRESLKAREGYVGPPRAEIPVF